MALLSLSFKILCYSLLATYQALFNCWSATFSVHFISQLFVKNDHKMYEVIIFSDKRWKQELINGRETTAVFLLKTVHYIIYCIFRLGRLCYYFLCTITELKNIDPCRKNHWSTVYIIITLSFSNSSNIRSRLCMYLSITYTFIVI